MAAASTEYRALARQALALAQKTTDPDYKSLLLRTAHRLNELAVRNPTLLTRELIPPSAAATRNDNAICERGRGLGREGHQSLAAVTATYSAEISLRQGALTSSGSGNDEAAN